MPTPSPATLQAHETLSVPTAGRGFHEITRHALAFVEASGLSTGVLTVFCRHTSASLTIQENASPEVLEDLADWLDRLAPEDPGLYRHTLEGPDDMPAHLRCALTASTLSIPVIDRRPVLGTWQGVFLIEHRSHPHRREIVFHLIGA